MGEWLESIEYSRGQQVKYMYLSMFLNILSKKNNNILIAPKFNTFGISEHIQDHMWICVYIMLELYIICFMVSLLFTGLCCL